MNIRVGYATWKPGKPKNLREFEICQSGKFRENQGNKKKIVYKYHKPIKKKFKSRLSINRLFFYYYFLLLSVEEGIRKLSKILAWRLRL